MILPYVGGLPALTFFFCSVYTFTNASHEEIGLTVALLDKKKKTGLAQRLVFRTDLRSAPSEENRKNALLWLSSELN